MNHVDHSVLHHLVPRVSSRCAGVREIEREVAHLPYFSQGDNLQVHIAESSFRQIGHWPMAEGSGAISRELRGDESAIADNLGIS